MSRKRFRWMAVALMGGAIGGILPLPHPAHSDVDDSRPPKLAIGHHPTSREEHGPKSRSSGSAGSGGMWIGTAGIALALAAFGGVSLAAKKFRPSVETGPLRVVGRTRLSPKHTVYLLQAGDRVLIVGTGSQGAPSLLGEMPDGRNRPIGGES